MDERHWWITTKLQKTFHIGIFDEPTLLEDFMSEKQTVTLLDCFFKPNGYKVIFFYILKNNDEIISMNAKQIHTATSVTENLAEILNQVYLSVYFIRKSLHEEVHVSSIEQDIMSGELTQNGLILYSDILQNVFLPILKSTDALKDVLHDEQNSFILEIDKYSQVLTEYSSGTLAPIHILRLPDKELDSNFKKKRQEALNPKVLYEYEQLVMEWITSVENVVLDSLDDKYDMYCSPMSMLTEWRQRMKLLQGVIDELKTKEIKSVIGVLIIAKSKMIKSWKLIDSCLTDAFNDIKDRVKYLEALRKCFEQLQNEASFPSLTSTVLPEFMSTIRLLDSVSKFYAKNGFLGSLMAKVSHQLVSLCAQTIQAFISSEHSDGCTTDEQLWQSILKEIRLGKMSRDKNRSKPKSKNPTISILTLLYDSVSVLNYYKDVYYSLKDALGGSNNLQYNLTTGSRHIVTKKINQVKSNMSTLHSSSSNNTLNTLDEQFSSQHDVSVPSNLTVNGVSFLDETTIMQPIIVFNKRIDQLVDVVEALKQFHKLIEMTRELPLLSFNEDEIPLVDLSHVDESDQKIGISDVVSDLFQDATSVVKVDLNFNIFVDIESSTKERFEKLYSNFVKVVEKMEAKVVQYIKIVFKLQLRTCKALSILSCFQHVMFRNGLSAMFIDKYELLLNQYEEDLEYVERRYEVYKDNPEAPRNMPVVSSALYWVQGLFKKIDDSMNILKKVKIIANSKAYKNVIRTYNRLITVFTQYEEAWLRTWLTQTEPCLKLLNSTLLAQEVTTGKVVVYADPSVLEIFADIKLLKRLNIKIPDHLLEFCGQEQKYKFYKQMLDYLVGEYYAVCDHIPEHLQTITNPLCKATLLYFQPALTVLRWDSVNVDAFLYRVEQVLTEFRGTVGEIMTISNEIDEIIDDIQYIVLFERPSNSSKIRHPEEFQKSQKDSIRAQGSLLNNMVIKIEENLQKIVSIVTQRNHKKPNTASASLRVSNSHSYMNSLIHENSNDELAVDYAVEKKIVSELFAYYATQVYNAVIKSIHLSMNEYLNCVSIRKTSEDSNGESPHLRFRINLVFSLPDLVLVPLLSDVQHAISQIGDELIDVSENIYWWDALIQKTFHQCVQTDEVVLDIKSKIDRAATELEERLTQARTKFYHFSFLWLEDMNSLYSAFEKEETDTDTHHKEVQHIIDIERQICDIDDEIDIDVIVFDTTLIKDSLCGFCSAWKMCYVQKLHQVAKAKLDEMITQQDVFHSHLTGNIVSLDDLNNVLNEMQKLTDMQSQIDGMYLPVEEMYRVLMSEYGIPLPRKEVETVNHLRDKWSTLVELADQVSQELMREKRPVFEQELDKEVKAFVVEVIQFRNSFDSQGPAIPGISPDEAFVRLKDFQALFKRFDAKKETLHAVQRLFGIQPMPFDELKKTGEELLLLDLLYSIFQQFIKLDNNFRDLLWEDANLIDYHEEVKVLWENCMNLPQAVRNWHQFKELKDVINNYLQIFPLLHKLASKEIRNRHWLQVMQVTKKTFQLEANIFKLNHILDIGLIEHKDAIGDILLSSHAELELELKLRHIAEEWSEQVIKFENLIGRDLLIFNREHTNNLLDALEDGKTSLSVMLTSKYIKPLRDEAASWSVKLNEIGEVLEQWLAVEELWMNLEAVFTSETAVKDLPQQYANYTKADRLYRKLIKMAVETPNVVQCCLSTDTPKLVLLRQVHKGLDVCFKGLSEYLDEKRKVFPRFNFVPDEILLSILSKPNSVEAVLPFLRETMTAIYDIKTSKNLDNIGESSAELSPMPSSTTKDMEYGSVLDLTGINPNLSQPKFQNTKIVSVVDMYGEKLDLRTDVPIGGNVEDWFTHLLQSTKDSVNAEMMRAIDDINDGGCCADDLIVNDLSQVGLNLFIYYWTRECERAINDIRIDRKSCSNLSKKLAVMNSRMTTALIRGSWRSGHMSLSHIQRRHLEYIAGVGVFLRDTFDTLVGRKLRDANDYEWKQTIRIYQNEEDESLDITIFENSFSYSNEFLGCKLSLVMSPVTERCFLNLGQAIKNCAAGCVSGPPIAGKVEIVKGLACLLGQHLLPVSCTMEINQKALENIFKGIAEDGSWCCFSDFENYSKDITSVLHHYMKLIFECLKSDVEGTPISKYNQMKVLPSTAIFFTTSLSHIHKECSVSFKSLLRNVSIIKPDVMCILKAWLISKGFKFAKVLSYNLKSLADICADQMASKWNLILPVFKAVITNASWKQAFIEQKEDGYQDSPVRKLNTFANAVNTFAQSSTRKKSIWARVRRSIIPTYLNETFKVEFECVVQSLNEVIGARLSDEELFIFKSIVKSVFGKTVPNEKSIIKYSNEEEDMRGVILNVLKEKDLTVHQPFADKVFQIYQLSQLHHGILVCGPGASGKSTAITVMIDALQVLATKSRDSSYSYKQIHLNVLSVSNLKYMFGHLDESGEWVDGVFTSIMKKANQQLTIHKLSTWITLDGPLHDDWCSPLKTLVKEEKVFVESNRRSHHLSEHVKILYETDDLSSASPSVISTMGLCYLDNSIVGWRPLADAWIAGRPSKQIHALQVLFNKTLDAVMQFVQEEAELCVHLSNSVLFTSCLNLLSSLLEDHPELSGDLHIQRLFMFSLIWVFGGLINNDSDRNHFNALILSLTNVLPDDDRAISIFDYFVDESGEWDTWETKLQETVLEESIDPFGNIYVESIISIRTRSLLQLFTATGNHVLLAGNSCAGKSSFMQNSLIKTVEKNQITKKVVFSALTDATFLQQIVDSSLHHRQGFVYGAKNNKTLKLFIEDLHLPSNDICDEQSANELLRQLLDQGMLFTHTKPYKQKYIEGLLVLATMNPSFSSTKADKTKLSRLLGKFCTVQLPEPTEKQIYSISSVLLQTYMTMEQGLGLPIYLHEKMVDASTKVLVAVSKSLNGCKTRTQAHYMFNIGDLTKVFQMLRRCPEESREEENDTYLLTFWYHEMKRTFGDRISNMLDYNFFNNTLNEISKTMSSDPFADVEPLFITFAADAHLRSQRYAAASKQQKKRNTHQRVMSLDSLDECIYKYLYRYTNETNDDLSLVMHNFNFSQIVRLHRALSMEKNGSALLVSVQSKEMTSVVKLTTFMLQYEFITADCTNTSNFLHGLRGAVRITGCDNKHCIVMILASEIKDPVCVEAIHSLLSIGEYAPLFTDTELHSLIVALLPTIKKSFSTFLSDPKSFFTACIKKNLHFVIVASPDDNFMLDLQKGYPSIITTCYMDWLPSASALHLQQEAYAVLSETEFWESYDEDLRNKLIETCEKIHTNHLKYCKDETGPASDLCKPTDVLKNKILTCLDSGEENSYSINIVTYKRFLHCLEYILRTKLKVVLAKAKQRSVALDCLDAIEEKCDAMKDEKIRLQQEYEIKNHETETLQDELFAKSTLIERLKGKLDVGSGTFRAFMALMEGEADEPVEEYLFEDEYDELDEEYEKLKTASRVQIKSLDEKIEELTGMLEDYGKDMTTAQKNLQSFQVKVDRGCIERLRAYQSPPTLVGTIMVMVMILIGRPEFSSYVVVTKPERQEKKDAGHLSITHSINRATSSASSRNIAAKDKRGNNAGISTDGKVDRSTWKTIQLIMQDSQKFCELMNAFDWQQGVSDDVLRTVISFFAPGEELPLSERDEPVNATPVTSNRPPKDVKGAGISLQAAKYSSEDAAQMVEYVQQVVNYTCKYRPYHQILQTLNALKEEKANLERKKLEAEMMQEESDKFVVATAEEDVLDNLTEVDLPQLEADLVKLQEDFDNSAMSKFKLKDKIREFTTLYETTIQLLKSFVPQKKAWNEFCTTMSDGLNLLTNAVVSAACLSYGGPLDIDKRTKIQKELFSICQDNGIPHTAEESLSRDSMMAFLGSEIEMKNFELLWPGTDTSLMDLTCFITQHQCSDAWPLICDPTHSGIFLLRRLYPDALVINYYDINDELEVALTQGYFIIVTDVNLSSLVHNEKMRSIIEAHDLFTTSNANSRPFKLMVGEKELDCSPNFRLIMTTTSDCTDVSPSLNLLVNVVRFSLSRNALYELFLNRYMLREKSRLEDSLRIVNREMLSLMQSMEVIEEKLLNYLVDQSYFDNITFIRKVLNTKKMLDEATHNKVKAEETYQTIKLSREVYQPIAICAAVLFKVSSVMRKIHPNYQISINQFLCYFDNALKITERSAVAVAAEKVLDSIFFVLSKSKLEVDRPLFGLFTALEIEDCQGRVAIGDREYIISPMFGAAVKQASVSAEHGVATKLSMKKPFDWMTDEQYQNLLILSQHFDWFADTFDKMSRDGREMQWRLIAEHDFPETLSLPDNCDERYTPLQRFMVLRAIRNDRFMQSASLFIAMTLGKKFSVDPVLDLEQIYFRSTPNVPIIMLYAKDLFLTHILLNGMKTLKMVHLSTYQISGTRMERETVMTNTTARMERETIMASITDAIEKGSWLYLCDIQNSCLHTREIIDAIKDVKSDNTFRLWLSAEVSAQLSVGMLHSCLPIIIDAAKLNFKHALVQNLGIINSDVWKEIKRPDWFPLLYNLCMLHGSLLQRWKMVCYGVRASHEFDFDLTKFIEALKFVYKEASKLISDDVANRPNSGPKVMNWAAIKSYLMKMVYGREITNTTDVSSLNALVEFWVSSPAQRRDFELVRVHYKHPQALYGGNTKSTSVLQAVEAVPTTVFESSEFCGLFHVPEVAASVVTYCLGQLKFLRDNTFGSSFVLDQSDARSVFSDTTVTTVPATDSLFNFHNPTASLLIDSRLVELSELLPSLLQKMPRLWNKEFVAERIRKTSGLTAFNMWLLAEADAMCALHFTIKTSLMKLNELITATTPYYGITPEVMEDVMDIYNGLVPKRWCEKAGPSCPPQHWSITSWLSDFQQRCSHIEKILIQGRDKFAGYWMAAFFNPRRLIAVVIQEMFRSARNADSPADDNWVLKTEITNRDKDHLRDPASEGIFIYGLHLWGASREKATNELHDSPPKSTPYSLPVIHLQVVSEFEKAASFSCPCYVSRLNTGDPILHVDIEQKDVPQYRWALRGLCCTMRPF